MKHFFVWILLASLVWGLRAGADQGRVFGDAFVGDGVRYRSPDWDDELFPVNVNNSWGYINQHGQLVVLPQFDWADYFHGGVARVAIEGLTGYINTEGRWVIEPQYRWADRFEEGSAIVGDGRNKFGFINRAGIQTMPVNLDGALRFREGLAAVMSGGRIGYIDRKGRLAIPYRFGRARSFRESVAVVQLPGVRGADGQLGYIDRAGEFVFDATANGFEDLGDFNNNYAPVKKNGRWGFINRDFQVVIEPVYEVVRGFYGGLAAVRSGGKWGYINDEGETVIEPRFDEAFDFGEVLALVKLDGRWGYADREGRLAISPQFRWAHPYFRDIARVEQEPNFGYIDINGRIIWDPRGVFDGIFDLTRIRPNGDAPRIPAPPRRRAVKVPYTADYLYVDELPVPSRRGR